MNTSIRSSSLPRFMVCSGFKHLDLPQEESGEAAQEGTAFHEYLEKKFKNIPTGAKASNGWSYDSEMEHYADKILPRIPTNAICETSIGYFPTPEFEVTGTLDYAWEEDGGDTLVIMDIKYGHRIVEVEKNWQLLSYAIGYVMKEQKGYSKVILRIIQPRPHHPEGFERSWSMSMQELFERYKEIQNRCADYVAGKIVFATSDKCRHCPAAGEKCSAMNRAFNNAVDVVMNTRYEDNLTGEEISDMLNTYARVKDIFDIKSKAMNDLAKEKIKAGVEVGDYDVEPNYKNRTWRSSVTPEIFKMMTGIDMTKVEMKSPAELEKMKVDELLIKQLTVRDQNGFKLKKVDKQKKAEQMFAEGN